MLDTVASMEAAAGIVELDLSIEDPPLPTRTAVPLGLVVNELATNSLKYAFRGRDAGGLGLHMSAGTEGLEMAIRDGGPGIDPEAHVDSGLGQRLVAPLVEQLGGTLDHDSSAVGTRHTLRIPPSGVASLED